MENKLPSENLIPEDEYPALGAEPIKAAEPVAQAPEADQAPEPQAVQQPTQPIQQYPQGGVPYMTYPIYPPMPGMPYPQQPQQSYPQQAYSQQPYPQQPYPPQQGMNYPNYTQYYAPYPPQQPVQPVQPIQPQGYVPEQPYTVPEEKKKSSTGTKAFLIILSALLLAMVAGFIVYIVNASNKDAAKSKQNSDPFSIMEGEDGDTPFNIFGGGDEDYELESTELEEEITLVADDGATQKRDTDNPDSVGKPDKDAASIKLKSAPKDADDSSKYTAKSSFNTLADSVVTISCYDGEITENIYDIKSAGSGVIISSDGYIVTNAHVLANSRMYAVNVILNSGKEYQAKIVGYDTWTDLAVLKIDAKDLKPAEFADSEKVEVGDDVIAIGSPGGAKYQNSLTQGVISAVDREISVNKVVRYIQSDAAINPGSSGGPLCNLCGQVIGITTAKTVAQNYESMSFSIPSAVVKDIVTDLMHYGYVPDRTRIGFSGSEVTADEKLYYGIPAGVIVGTISEDGALADTEVKEGDVITAIDGETVGSFQDIYNILSKHKSGDKVKLSIFRVEEEGFFAQEPTESAK